MNEYSIGGPADSRGQDILSPTESSDQLITLGYVVNLAIRGDEDEERPEILREMIISVSEKDAPRQDAIRERMRDPLSPRGSPKMISSWSLCSRSYW